MKITQLNAVRCALADLIGAQQAYQMGDLHAHDWEAHSQTIDELAKVFGLQDELAEERT